VLESLLGCVVKAAGAVLLSFGFVGKIATEPYPPSPETRTMEEDEIEREWMVIEEASDYLKDL